MQEGVDGWNLRGGINAPPPSLSSMRNMNKSDLAKSLMAVIPSCPVKGCQQAWSY